MYFLSPTGEALRDRHPRLTLNHLQVDEAHVCNRHCTFTGNFPNFICVTSGKVHKCGANCGFSVPTDESRVCMLTGYCTGQLDGVLQVSMKTDSRGNANFDKHWIMRKKKKTRTGAKKMGLDQIRGCVFSTLKAIFSSRSRRDLHKGCMQRFKADVLKQFKTKGSPKDICSIVGISRDVLNRHSKFLNPPAEPSSAFMEHHCRRIPLFFKTLFPEGEMTRKSVAVFTATVIQHESQKGGLTVSGHSVIHENRWATVHAPSSLQYGSLGLCLTCRNMSVMSREMQSRLTVPGTTHPRDITF